MRRFVRHCLFILLLAVIVLPAIGCGEEDCSGDGANCALIVAGEEPPCCEGLRCQESIITGDLVCR